MELHSFHVSPADDKPGPSFYVTLSVEVPTMESAFALARLLQGMDSVAALAPPTQNAVVSPAPATPSKPRGGAKAAAATPAPTVAVQTPAGPVAMTSLPAPTAGTAEYPKQVTTEHGVAQIENPGGIVFVAKLAGFQSPESGSEDDALNAVMTLVDQAKAAQRAQGAPVQTTVQPPKAVAGEAMPEAAAPTQAAPAVAGVDAPPELAKAGSFRQVMQWMIDNGFTTTDAVREQCTKYSEVPAIKRQPGDLSERIGRALAAMLPTPAGATA